MVGGPSPPDGIVVDVDVLVDVDVDVLVDVDVEVDVLVDVEVDVVVDVGLATPWTLRTRKAFRSAISKLPELVMSISFGCCSRAEVAGPLSPTPSSGNPPPATVVMICVTASTLRTVLRLLELMKRSPAASRAIACGFVRVVDVAGTLLM